MTTTLLAALLLAIAAFVAGLLVGQLCELNRQTRLIRNLRRQHRSDL